MHMDIISIKTPPETKKMQRGGKIAIFAMQEVASRIKPGVTTLELDEIAYRIIRARGAEPSFLNYEGFPNSTCISINSEVVHGIPSRVKLKDGDVVKVDLGIYFEGYHTDMARTFTVGKVTRKVKDMVLTGKKALDNAIDEVKPGGRVGDIEQAIGDTLREGGLAPVMSLSGHGIGVNLHEKPSIFCDGKRSAKEELLPGMVIAIEPMAIMGSGEVKRKDDGWTVVSSNGNIAVHFEDTVAVTDTGHKVLTRGDKPDKIFL